MTILIYFTLYTKKPIRQEARTQARAYRARFLEIVDKAGRVWYNEKVNTPHVGTRRFL